MKKFTSEKQRIGQVGEDVACKFLEREGFVIRERNYTKKFGEIDIVAEKDGELRFFEIKTIVTKNPDAPTYGIGNYRPEENLDFIKFHKMSRTIHAYLVERFIPEDTYWQVDLIAVLLDPERKRARVRVTENVIL